MSGDDKWGKRQVVCEIIGYAAIIVLLVIVAWWVFTPSAQGCVLHECSNDNSATGPVTVGDELARADAIYQWIDRYEWRRGEEICYVQPYRETYNRTGHHWTKPWFQPYASACAPLEGWMNYYRVRACRGAVCSPDSSPVEFFGLHYCDFNDPNWKQVCFGVSP